MSGRRTWRLYLALVIAGGCASSCGSPSSPPDRQLLQYSDAGLGVVTFGDSHEGTLTTLRGRWGPEQEIRETSCESFASVQLVFWDGAYVVLSPDGLVGYQVGPFEPGVPTLVAEDVNAGGTREGLQLGSSVATARELYGDAFTLSQSSLGSEFYVEDQDDWPFLAGFTDGLEPDSEITHIYSGDICAVR